METTTNKILVVFKTHLDLGFTGLAETVRQKYMTEYIPNALRLARETRESPYRFRWTVGSWLLEEYRKETGDSGELAEAVEAGDIRWHALPFTTHTEYMDAGLLDHGLSISRRLDARYGQTTVAAKLTDVPGHTAAMVPHLAKAGVKFLHIGVNPASTVPEVPPLFWWQAPTGERVLVMYNGNYGEMTPIGQSGVSVCFAHTGDNCGPQSAAEIESIYQKLQTRYPGAVLRAATLEDVAAAALAQEALPVLAEEIGDSWIHGTGSDPAKTSAYRALLRLGETLPPAQRTALYDGLLPVPEHTWGLDEKTHLTGTYSRDFQYGEHRFFVRQEFEAARNTPPFRLMEQSWQEQRDYVSRAAAAAGVALPAVRRAPTDLHGWEPVEQPQGLSFGGFTVDAGPDGSLCGLTYGGQVWADAAHPLGGFRYEVFSQQEYDRFRAQYVTSDEDWAIEDFGKIGVDKANDRYRSYRPAMQVYRREDALLVRGTFPREARERFGAPAQAEILFQFEDGGILVDAAWSGKPASRIPEALWMEFSPCAQLKAVHKLDAWLDPFRVVRGGNRRMHVTQKGVAWDGLRIEGLDTGLASLGGPTLLQFDNTLPERDAGAWFCLFNNVWGTNFPMWYGEEARFRFIIQF